MSRVHTELMIEAPLEKVFDTVAHIENFQKAVPHILRVEPLGEIRSGVGTRFRETRRMGQREATTVLEVTEYAANERVRLISDEGGTVWDSLFETRSEGDGTRLSLTMDARPHKLLSRLTVPLMMRMIRSAVEEDLVAVKEYCEGAS